MIVYGVEESQKVATARKDTGEFTEVHERALCSAAITAVTPPVFGLEIHRLGDHPRAVAVIVPASVDGQHLIYRGEYFGAPVRNNADTVWMKERQIEAMYRARFDERRLATEAVDVLYREAAAGRDSANRSWLIAIAHPRIPGTLVRLTSEEAREVFAQAEKISLSYSNRKGIHPLLIIVASRHHSAPLPDRVHSSFSTSMSHATANSRRVSRVRPTCGYSKVPGPKLGRRDYA